VVKFLNFTIKGPCIPSLANAPLARSAVNQYTTWSLLDTLKGGKLLCLSTNNSIGTNAQYNSLMNDLAQRTSLADTLDSSRALKHKRKGETMRRTVLTAAVVLLAATPSLAAAKHQTAASTPTYSACEALAVARGVLPGQGASNPDGHHITFVRECLAGKVPFTLS
jgi:hypothetical protein